MNAEVLWYVYLDDSVRTLFERGRQYDHENGSSVCVLLFPDLTFSDIVNLPYSEGPKKVSSLIQNCKLWIQLTNSVLWLSFSNRKLMM
jgi:hypothetical protein